MLVVLLVWNPALCGPTIDIYGSETAPGKQPPDPRARSREAAEKCRNLEIEALALVLYNLFKVFFLLCGRSASIMSFPVLSGSLGGGPIIT